MDEIQYMDEIDDYDFFKEPDIISKIIFMLFD